MRNFTALDVSRFHAGELDRATQAGFAEHLGTCAVCSSHLHAQRELDALVKQLPTYPLPSKAQVASKPRLIARVWTGVGILAAAALALVALQLFDSRGRSGLIREAAAADAAWLSASIARQGTPPRPSARVARLPWLGYAHCGANIAPRVDGVFLCALLRTGPLGLAGARAGDVLTSVGGTPVRSVEDVNRVLADYEVGDSVDVRFLQRGSAIEAVVQVSSRTDGYRNPFTLEWSAALIEHAENLAPGEVDPFDLFKPVVMNGDSAILITRSVTQAEWSRTRLMSSFAYPFGENGVRGGDMIIAIDGAPVKNHREFFEAYGRVGSRPITLAVRRGGEQPIIQVRPMR